MAKGSEGWVRSVLLMISLKKLQRSALIFDVNSSQPCDWAHWCRPKANIQLHAKPTSFVANFGNRRAIDKGQAPRFSPTLCGGLSYAR